MKAKRSEEYARIQCHFLVPPFFSLICVKPCLTPALRALEEGLPPKGIPPPPPLPKGLPWQQLSCVSVDVFLAIAGEWAGGDEEEVAV